MKFAAGLLVLMIAGYFALEQFKPKPPPAPPPPPPAITLDPSPIISEAEQAKIVRSANDQDPAVRWEAMVLLDKMKSPKAMPVLFEKLLKDPEGTLRIKIIELLTDRHSP